MSNYIYEDTIQSSTESNVIIETAGGIVQDDLFYYYCSKSTPATFSINVGNHVYNTNLTAVNSEDTPLETFMNLCYSNFDMAGRILAYELSFNYGNSGHYIENFKCIITNTNNNQFIELLPKSPGDVVGDNPNVTYSRYIFRSKETSDILSFSTINTPIPLSIQFIPK